MNACVSPMVELLFTFHCILDCPEASQTSPTKTFRSVTRLPMLSATLNSAGLALALSGSSESIHLPDLPATAIFVWPANSTVTFVPGSLHPQTGTLIPRWRTALSRNGAPSSMARPDCTSSANRPIPRVSRSKKLTENNLMV